MQVMQIRAFFIRLGWQGQQSQEDLPAYSALGTSLIDSTQTPSHDDGVCENSSFDNCRMDHRRDAAPSHLPQFLSHFTLGFADGLTVPFALTAGLSSLGQTKTVIYAGMAEICAGCISMGISGYLAARGETEVQTDSHDYGEKLETAEQDNVERYLAPLDLPLDLLRSVRAHIDSHPTIIQRFLSDVNLTSDGLAGRVRGFSPVIIGLSISFGYMLGGLLPLFPYFFVSEVDDGMWWSFVVCILALFTFGFAKDYLLHLGSVEDGWQDGKARRERRRWERIKQGSLEGIRMVTMGGLAALAAVLCVRLFEGVVL
ncbi:DUF125-domain-containing protein [Hypoxylon crocopeplum]|nr:DUF125-domain-containing protein [Hypoxylon crocopeplum]